MSLLSTISKLSTIITKPIEALTDWATEPLKAREHSRSEVSRNSAHQRDIELQDKKIKSEARAQVEKKTEIKRIITEIEEWKKDKELERMEKVSEAIMRYQKELTRLNVDAINAIGHMQLDLREKAQELVYTKTIKYKELQDTALKEAMIDLEKIETQFSNNKVAKELLTKAVDKKLSNIIDTAQNFLLELNSDIKLLNQSINLLAEKGQGFIEGHLEKFHAADLKQLEGNSHIKNIEYDKKA